MTISPRNAILPIMLALGIGQVLGGCGPVEQGDPGERGPQGEQGVQGIQGTQGAQGPGGTTGQDVFEAFGSGQLTVSSATTSYTLVPGLSLTINIPADAKVRMETNGGLQCTSTGSAYSVVDLALFVDNTISTTAGQRRIVASNTPVVGQMIANWSFGRTYELTAGSHQFEVRAINVDPSAAPANVSSVGAPQLQGVLTVTVIKQ